MWHSRVKVYDKKYCSAINHHPKNVRLQITLNSFLSVHDISTIFLFPNLKQEINSWYSVNFFFQRRLHLLFKFMFFHANKKKKIIPSITPQYHFQMNTLLCTALQNVFSALRLHYGTLDNHTCWFSRERKKKVNETVLPFTSAWRKTFFFFSIIIIKSLTSAGMLAV